MAFSADFLVDRSRPDCGKRCKSSATIESANSSMCFLENQRNSMRLDYTQRPPGDGGVNSTRDRMAVEQKSAEHNG